MEIGVACATFGLVLGGVTGGPIAQFLIKKHKLTPAKINPELTVGKTMSSTLAPITYDRVIAVFLLIAVAAGLGEVLAEIVASAGLDLPPFVTALFAGILLHQHCPLYCQRHALARQSPLDGVSRRPVTGPFSFHVVDEPATLDPDRISRSNPATTDRPGHPIDGLHHLCYFPTDGQKLRSRRHRGRLHRPDPGRHANRYRKYDRRHPKIRRRPESLPRRPPRRRLLHRHRQLPHHHLLLQHPTTRSRRSSSHRRRECEGN